MTDTAWEALSNQAVAAAGVVYFLALIAHLVEHAAARRVLEPAPHVPVSACRRPRQRRVAVRRVGVAGRPAGRTTPARPLRSARPACSR